MKLQGQQALITGASRGLGAAIAAAFWREGASLLLSARDAGRLRVAAESLAPRPGQSLHCFAADLSDPAAGAALVAEARAVFPRLDILVKNAGTQGQIGPAWENDEADWRRAIEIDLLAPVALCRLAVPWMATTGGGRIVNVSGGGATSPRARFSAYAAAKTALVRFTETLAAEAAGLRIRVNAVAPGAMDTDLLREVAEAGPERAGEREYAAARHAQAAGGATAARAAELVVFLASAASDGITGKLISAVWDPWERLSSHADDLRRSDIYTLRRIVPEDRGLDWD